MTTVLQAMERKDKRRETLTKIRKEGNIPAVVYGPKKPNMSIFLSESDLQKTIKDVGRNGIISLEINGNKQNVILTDYQVDPLKNGFVHVDFLAVDMTKEITADVNVTLVGDAAGVKDGGVMQQSLFEVSVSAKPADIPGSIDVDVSNLQVGETITISDLNVPYTINHDEDVVIASILAPRQEEEISSGEKQEEGTPENEEGRETKASNESKSNE
ncbi:50S ribosomal protein L25/general stress protein Ctc [Niallia sp. Krafla_26]|uniref:50S ribosomal protein L25/general stress protein Ctc n=1 Tax=Niallia sp. Krafla_26 TaxID=3064703 RepID=UPI003D16D991